MTGSTILQDYSGPMKLRPWAERKRQSIAVAEAFSALGPKGRKRHERMTKCGAILEFQSRLRPATGERQKLRTKSSFCKQRMCPNCQWRRSLSLFAQVAGTVQSHLEASPTDRLLLLTLTAQNCPGAELSAAVSKATTAFRRLSDSGDFKRAVKGWFRSVEVTRNADRGDYHPHLHVLLVVPAAYFDRERDLYRPTTEWVQAWRKALRAPYSPICDVRTVGGREPGFTLAVLKGLVEVTKYCTKPADWLAFEGGPAGSWRADPQVVAELGAGLRSKRLTGWGGVLREIYDAGRRGEPDGDDQDVLGWRDLPPGWVVEALESYNYRGRRPEQPGDFYLVNRRTAR